MSSLPVQRPATCNQDMWDRYLATPDLPEHLLTWMINQACGWPFYDFADPADLYLSLLRSRLLTEEHLIALCGGEGPTARPAARALLEHDATTPRVVAEFLHRLVLRDQAQLNVQVWPAVFEDPRPWVRAMAQVRRQGLATWYPNETGLTSGRWREREAAEESYTEAMVRLFDEGGAAAGEALLALAEGTRIGPAEVSALLAALSDDVPVG